MSYLIILRATGSNSYVERRIAETEACKFFQQLISAIEYLHSVGCAHRDVKPSNILVDADMNLKLIDFGLGNLYGDDQLLKTACGSPCYAAPELISGDRYEPLLVDIWSSGVTLYVMLYGLLPFDEDDKGALYKKILDCDYKLPSSTSEVARDLVRGILVRNPDKRISVEDIKNHPWMKITSVDYFTDPNSKLMSLQSNGKNYGSKIIEFVSELVTMTAEKFDISKDAILQMLREKDRNKYTTLYHLLKKKYDRNEITFSNTVKINKQEKKRPTYKKILPEIETPQITPGDISINQNRSTHSRNTPGQLEKGYIKRSLQRQTSKGERYELTSKDSRVGSTLK